MRAKTTPYRAFLPLLILVCIFVVSLPRPAGAINFAATDVEWRDVTILTNIDGSYFKGVLFQLTFNATLYAQHPQQSTYFYPLGTYTTVAPKSLFLEAVTTLDGVPVTPALLTCDGAPIASSYSGALNGTLLPLQGLTGADPILNWVQSPHQGYFFPLPLPRPNNSLAFFYLYEEKKMGQIQKRAPSPVELSQACSVVQFLWTGVIQSDELGPPRFPSPLPAFNISIPPSAHRPNRCTNATMSLVDAAFTRFLNWALSGPGNDDASRLVATLPTFTALEGFDACSNSLRNVLNYSEVSENVPLSAECPFDPFRNSSEWQSDPCCNPALAATTCCVPRPITRQRTLPVAIRSDLVNAQCRNPSRVTLLLADYIKAAARRPSLSYFDPSPSLAYARFLESCLSEYFSYCSNDFDCPLGTHCDNYRPFPTDRCVFNSLAEEDRLYQCILTRAPRPVLLEFVAEYMPNADLKASNGLPGSAEMIAAMQTAASFETCFSGYPAAPLSAASYAAYKEDQFGNLQLTVVPGDNAACSTSQACNWDILAVDPAQCLAYSTTHFCADCRDGFCESVGDISRCEITAANTPSRCSGAGGVFYNASAPFCLDQTDPRPTNQTACDEYELLHPFCVDTNDCFSIDSTPLCYYFDPAYCSNFTGYGSTFPSAGGAWCYWVAPTDEGDHHPCNISALGVVGNYLAGRTYSAAVGFTSQASCESHGFCDTNPFDIVTVAQCGSFPGRCSHSCRSCAPGGLDATKGVPMGGVCLNETYDGITCLVGPNPGIDVVGYCVDQFNTNKSVCQATPGLVWLECLPSPGNATCGPINNASYVGLFSCSFTSNPCYDATSCADAGCRDVIDIKRRYIGVKRQPRLAVTMLQYRCVEDVSAWAGPGIGDCSPAPLMDHPAHCPITPTPPDPICDGLGGYFVYPAPNAAGCAAKGQVCNVDGLRRFLPPAECSACGGIMEDIYSYSTPTWSPPSFRPFQWLPRQMMPAAIWRPATDPSLLSAIITRLANRVYLRRFMLEVADLYGTEINLMKALACDCTNSTDPTENCFITSPEADIVVPVFFDTILNNSATVLIIPTPAGTITIDPAAFTKAVATLNVGRVFASAVLQFAGKKRQAGLQFAIVRDGLGDLVGQLAGDGLSLEMDGLSQVGAGFTLDIPPGTGATSQTGIAVYDPVSGNLTLTNLTLTNSTGQFTGYILQNGIYFPVYRLTPPPATGSPSPVSATPTPTSMPTPTPTSPPPPTPTPVGLATLPGPLPLPLILLALAMLALC